MAPPPKSIVLDRATAYARDVVEGKIVTGRLVRLACERHLNDMERKDVRWRVELSERVITFFGYLNHIEGPLASKPIVLAPWQCFSIGAVFGWQLWNEERQKWVRRFRTAFTEVAKKNGKSTTAAGIGLLLAFFDGEMGAHAYAIATKKDQAKLVWTPAKIMVQRTPKLSMIKAAALSLFNPMTNSSFAPLSSEAGTEDGINPNGIIADEIHRIEDRALLDLMKDSFGARENPIIYEITTAGSKGDSVWAEEHDYAEDVLEGIIVDDRLFAYIANLDEGDDPWDEANWPKANPNLGVSVFRDDLRVRALEAQAKPASQNSFLRLRMNVRTDAESRWMTNDFWKKGEDPPKPLNGRTTYMGLDLGSRFDLASAALLAWDEVEEKLDWHPIFWLPEDAVAERVRKDKVPYDRWIEDGLIKMTPGNVTDYDTIRKDINEIYGQEGQDSADIWEIGYDPHDATQLSTQLMSDGFRLVRIPQSTLEFEPAVAELERMLSRGEIRHGNNPVLMWMMSNTQLIVDASGHRKPDKMHARDRIDGIVAGLLALKRYMATAGREQSWTAA